DWSSDVCSSDLIILKNQGMAWWLRSLHCRLTARRSYVRFPHGPLLVRGAGPPQTFSAQVGYLPGRSVWSLHVLPVFTRVFLHLEPRQTKHAKEQITLLSVPDQDRHDHLTWSPGAIKAPHCSCLPWRKDSPGWEDAEEKFTETSSACVCVCAK